MVLSENDSTLFYALWRPLLEYANNTLHVNDLHDIEHAQYLDPRKVKEVADALWNHVSIIEWYLKKHGSKLTEEERNIVSSWKKCRSGRYILERHLKKGSIFISEQNQVYLVSGIISSWEEMLGYIKPPIMMEMTILPFKDVLITDGLVMPYQVSFGPGIRNTLKEVYMDAKSAGEIITRL